MVGAVESVELDVGLCFFISDEAGASCEATCGRPVSYFALRYRAPLKGVISAVAVSVEVEQFRLKIPCVCGARLLV